MFQNPTKTNPAKNTVAALSVTIEDGFLFIRRVNVREQYRRQRFATFLVAAAQLLFSPTHPDLLPVAVEIRHPTNAKQYKSAINNRQYLFYVHGLHFRLAEKESVPTNQQSLVERINTQTEKNVFPEADTSTSYPYFKPYYCHWKVRDVLPDHYSLSPWALFNRLFRYSYEMFQVWRDARDVCPPRPPPVTREFHDTIINKIHSVPLSSCSNVELSMDDEEDVYLEDELMNSVFRTSADHLGYNISVDDIGSGSLPYFFHGTDDEPNPSKALLEKSCFYVVTSRTLFYSAKPYVDIRRCVARFIGYLGYLPTSDCFWRMKYQGSTLYDLLNNACIEMELGQNNKALAADIEAITPPRSPLDDEDHRWSRPIEELSSAEVEKETQVYMDKWWSERPDPAKVQNVCKAIAEVTT